VNVGTEVVPDGESDAVGRSAFRHCCDRKLPDTVGADNRSPVMFIRMVVELITPSELIVILDQACRQS
jgi:hypothetical protein